MEGKDFAVYELYGLYGSLLTEKQRDIVEDYFGLDLSLGEIAEIRGISRQAVNDALSGAKEQLHHYESKLRLLDKNKRIRKILERLDNGGDTNADRDDESFRLRAQLGKEIKNILEITEGR